MAIVVQSDAQTPVSFDEFLDYLHAHLNVRDRDSLLSASEMLIRLSRNSAFLAEHLCRILGAGLDDGFRRASRIFKLAEGKDFIIRALVWEPVPKGIHGSQFFYHIAHDHDFDFLTVCCLGPGLSSEVYQYDNTQIQGEKGESVSIEYQGRVTLQPGKAALFEGGKDIHIQLPPDELCITLNIMGPKHVERSPFWFDVEQKRIVDWVDHTQNVQSLLLNASRVLNDSSTVANLERIQATNPMFSHLAGEILDHIQTRSADITRDFGGRDEL
jgi:hypothetical protein